MAKLGKKWTCFSCSGKFYDFGKAESICPKCGANQKSTGAGKSKVLKKTKAAMAIDDDHAQEDEVLEEAATPEATLEPSKEGIDPGGLGMDDYDE